MLQHEAPPSLHEQDTLPGSTHDVLHRTVYVMHYSQRCKLKPTGVRVTFCKLCASHCSDKFATTRRLPTIVVNSAKS